jgi:MFS family permease
MWSKSKAMRSFGALSLAERDRAGGSSMLSIFGAVYVTVRLAVSRLADRVGPLPMIVTAVPTEAVGLVIIAIAPDWATAAVGATMAEVVSPSCAPRSR